MIKRYFDIDKRIVIQSPLDKWNLQETEKNGSTYRIFHLSEWFDKWNLNEIEKKVPFIEPLSYLKSQDTEEFTNTVIKNRVTVVFLFHYLIAIKFSHLKK